MIPPVLDCLSGSVSLLTGSQEPLAGQSIVVFDLIALINMKFSLTAALLALVPAAFAFPATLETAAATLKRLSLTEITDQYLFSLTLPQFTAKRNARDPSTLIWDSDGCTSSPDNPFGFPFTPACHRHDFGYRNYKNQNRFTDANKLKIDDNFKKE